MKLILTSDIHGTKPELPECDILIIAGDIFNTLDPTKQFKQLYNIFMPWLAELKYKHCVFIAGNHDTLFQSVPMWIPSFKDLNAVYLQDDMVEIEGVKIFGTPWQLHFGNLAFNAPEDGEEFLERRYSIIPEDVDIIISHGPPYGYGDLNFHDENCGSKALLNTIRKIQPKLVVTGHIHNAQGIYYIGKTTVVNAASTAIEDDKRYVVNPDKSYFVFDWETGEVK